MQMNGEAQACAGEPAHEVGDLEAVCYRRGLETPPSRLAQTGKEGIFSGHEAGGGGGCVSDGDGN